MSLTEISDYLTNQDSRLEKAMTLSEEALGALKSDIEALEQDLPKLNSKQRQKLQNLKDSSAEAIRQQDVALQFQRNLLH